MDAGGEIGHGVPARVGFVHRPMVGLALMVVAGTAVGLHAGAFPVGALVGGSVLLTAGALASWRAARQGTGASTWPASCALHAAAFLLACAAAAPILRGVTETPPLGAGEGRKGDALGVVIDEPDRLPVEHFGWVSWRVPFQIQSWRVNSNAWTKVQRPCVVWWTVWGDGRVPEYGERWRLRGVTWPEARRGDDRPGNRYASLRVRSRQAEFLSSGYGSPLRTWCYTARQRAAEHLALGISQFKEEAGIHQALMLGYRQRLSDRVEQLGAATGTLHVFAISGSHVAIIAVMCIFMLRTVGLSRERWIYLLAPLLIAYTIATGGQSSAVRACVMALACFLAPALGRRPDVPSALAFSAIAILAVDPTQVRDVGFVLSFVVVAGLIGLYPLFRVRATAWPRDPLDITPDSRGVRLSRAFVNELASLFALSCAAWVASTPLTAYYFERFTPISLIANLAVVPLAFLIVLSGCLSIVLGSCVGLLAELYNHAACSLISLFVVLTGWMTHVPLSNMPVVRPPVWMILLYYALVTAVAASVWVRRGAGLARTAESATSHASPKLPSAGG